MRPTPADSPYEDRSMTTELVPSGPDITRDGKSVTPLASLYRCEGCGYVGAPFGYKRGDEVVSYCGWDGHKPICVGKGKAER